MIMEFRPIVTRDSCDRCGVHVAARNRITTSNGPLTLCAHHTDHYAPVIIGSAYPVQSLVFVGPFPAESGE